MTQRHTMQEGIFHVTTVTRERMPWLTIDGISELILENLWMTRNIHEAEIYAFCILPDHMHIVIKPGKKGLSAFMHSFKRNSSWHARSVIPIPVAEVHEPPLRIDSMNMIPECTGWQKGFHDERIRDAQQFRHAMTYVHENAVHHDNVDDSRDWPWSSIHFPELVDHHK